VELYGHERLLRFQNPEGELIEYWIRMARAICAIDCVDAVQRVGQ
jgi:hypothetical protein